MKRWSFENLKASARKLRAKKEGNPVSKSTKVAGRRAGGALRAEQARQQKRRDMKH